MVLEQVSKFLLVDIKKFPKSDQALANVSVGGHKVHYYITLSKKDKGVVIRYLLKMTDYSRQQLTRLIKKYNKRERLTGRLVVAMALQKNIRTKYCSASKNR